MSRPRTPDPAMDMEGDSPTGTRNEDNDRTQHSHRMLNFSDALLSIIATVMVCGAVQRSLPCPAPTDPSHILPADPDPSQLHPGLPNPSGSCGGGRSGIGEAVSVHQPRKWPQPLLSLFSQILPVTHTEISPEQVPEHSLQCLGSGSGSLSPNLGST